MTGIACNEKLTATPITTVDQLLEDSKLKGKITLLNEMADTLGLVMQANGDDPSTVTDESFQKAIDRVQAAVDSGQIRRFTGNDYTRPLAQGDLIAALSLVGRHRPAPARQPQPQVGLAGDGRHDLDRQHAHPARWQTSRRRRRS